MRYILTLILFTLFASCAATPERKTRPVEPRPDPLQVAEVEDRFFNGFLEMNYVVSRKEGRTHHVGDSATWTAIAIGVLPCDKTQKMFNAMIADMQKNRGAFRRYPIIDQGYKGNETSFDVESALIFGFANRIKNCPADIPVMREAWREHVDFTNNGKHLYYELKASVPKGFLYVFDLLSYRLDVIPQRPLDKRKNFLATAMNAWTKGVVTLKKPCFRVHLAQLYFLSIEALGERINSVSFCKSTRKTELPLTDWYCGRIEAIDWLNTFRYNDFEYKHQRCVWESENNQWIETPALDYLTLYYLDKNRYGN